MSDPVVAGGDVDGKISWPLSFYMERSSHNPPPSATPQSQQQLYWWTHTLYHGPQGQTPRVLYSKTKIESEEIAQEFLGEKILGFDKEWPPFESEHQSRLQNRIGLIQIAAESKIALFHIGLHNGNTTQDLLAPSLRRLIESQTIMKVGVNIMNADFARLRRYFGMNPKGAFELSHLYNLVRLNCDHPDMLTTRFVKLSRQVEEVLGLPLSKEKSVRCSNWSQPLKIEQMRYATDDEYAGLMIFHSLDAERRALKSSPPLPVLADHYGVWLPKTAALCLQAPVTAAEFLRRSANQNTVSVNDEKPQIPTSSSGEVKVITFPSTESGGQSRHQP